MPTINPKEIDMFNAPIPGEMLTAEMGGRPWQRPPQFNTVEEAMDFYVEKLTDPKISGNTVSVIESGVPIGTLAETLMTSSVMQGIHSIDVGVLVVPFIMELMEYLCIEAGLDPADYDMGLEEEEDTSVVDSLAAKKFFKKFEDQVRNPETQPINDNVIQEEEEPQMEGEQPRGLMARGGM